MIFRFLFHPIAQDVIKAFGLILNCVSSWDTFYARAFKHPKRNNITDPFVCCYRLSADTREFQTSTRSAITARFFPGHYCRSIHNTDTDTRYYVQWLLLNRGSWTLMSFVYSACSYVGRTVRKGDGEGGRGGGRDDSVIIFVRFVLRIRLKTFTFVRYRL